MNLARPFFAGRIWTAIVVCLLFSSCLRYRYSDRELARRMNDAHLPADIHHLDYNGRHLRYLEVRTHLDSAPINLLMVHGSPSSLRIWDGYLRDSTLIRSANLYAPDRAGYGFSDFGHPDSSILSQVELLGRIIERHPGPFIIHGSSYGGPIAAGLAAKYPERVKGVLFTSPSLAPGEEKIYGVSHWIKQPALGWFFPAIFRVSNVEKLTHRRALEEVSALYPFIKAPVIYIYGGRDGLIYNSNADYAKAHFTGTHIKFILLKDRPHFFTFDEQPLIVGKLVELMR